MYRSSSLDVHDNYAISQIFSPSLLKKLHSQEDELNIKKLLHSCKLYPIEKEWNFVKALEISYKYLKKNYRCEYVYKNEIANQLLLRFHKDNSATLLKELSSDTSIADIVIINGKTVAYEIKTELDSFERLTSQIESYKCLYDHIFIVTHLGAVKSLIKKIDDTIGIIILSDRGVLKTVRKAANNVSRFNPAKAVLTLRQAELVSAYEKYVERLPPMGTALIYSFCYDWFLHLNNGDAHMIFAEALKSRKPSPQQFQLIKECSPSLKMLFLGKKISRKECLLTLNRLSTFG